jgi:hypothetical protein
MTARVLVRVAGGGPGFAVTANQAAFTSLYSLLLRHPKLIAAGNAHPFRNLRVEGMGYPGFVDLVTGKSALETVRNAAQVNVTAYDSTRPPAVRRVRSYSLVGNRNCEGHDIA